LKFNKEPEPTIMTKATNKQRVLVFQQNGSGQTKIAGLRKYGGESLVLESVSIDRTPIQTD
jgi:hypothetical protein